MPRVDDMLIEIDPLHLGLDETRLVEQRANGGDGVARLENPGTGFEKQRGHEEIVVAIDERDLDGLVSFEYPLEMKRRVYAAEAAAEDQDARDAIHCGNV